jgi:putative endonuclease
MTGERGRDTEDFVAARLEAAGWSVLGVRVRLGREEIDLVAVDPGPPPALVIVEIRWRGRRDFGLAEESLDRRKRLALRRAIGALLDAGALPGGDALPRHAVRVDLVVVEPGPAGAATVRHHRAITP